MLWRQLLKAIEGPHLALVGQLRHALKCETALASADQALDCPCEILTAALTRVDNLSHLSCQVGHSNRAIPMRLPPRRKHFDHALSRGVALLDLSDAVHRVGTTEGQQRIAHPYPPLLKTTERDPAIHFGLATPSPYREGGS